MKVCSKCKTEKDENEFYSNKRMPDGLDYYCKTCRKQATSSPITEEGYVTHEINRNFVESLKTDCCKCGENRPWVIQFHHINPSEKSFSLSTSGTRSRTSIWNEAQKCVCLCSNCHDEFHYFYGMRPVNPVVALDEYLNGYKY